MSSALHLDGTTVTLFGDRDVLDDALCDELGRRGCNTHTITIPMGWLTTATHVVIRLGTRAGEDAFRHLADIDEPPAQVVAVCERPLDADDSERLDALCRRRSEHHDISLIWHSPLVTVIGEHVDGLGPAIPTDDLASLVADEVVQHSTTTVSPGYASRTFVSGHA